MSRDGPRDLRARGATANDDEVKRSLVDEVVVAVGVFETGYDARPKFLGILKGVEETRAPDPGVLKKRLRPRRQKPDNRRCMFRR